MPAHTGHKRGLQSGCIAITIVPSRKTGRFDAPHTGSRLVTASRTPFLDAARAFLAYGSDPIAAMVMKRFGSDVVALRSAVGIATALTVADRSKGKPLFEGWRPMARSSSAVSPPIAMCREAAPQLPEALQGKGARP